ncbi:MAG: hypothetical protein ACREAQ_04480 [Nitrososphaera sp.]
MGKPRVSDAAVKKMTGKNWQQWFAVLDKAAGTRMSHRKLAEHLHQKLGVPGWWSQMIAVTYEQERGLREVHQKADGYAVSASRTFQVPVGVLYRQWSDAKIRGMWLREKFTVRKETKNKSMRITWGDGRTSVEVYFYSKGDSKSQVSVQHSKLASSKDVELARSRWKGALERLAKIL